MKEVKAYNDWLQTAINMIASCMTRLVDEKSVDIDAIMEDINAWTRKWIMKFIDIRTILEKHLLPK